MKLSLTSKSYCFIFCLVLLYLPILAQDYNPAVVQAIVQEKIDAEPDAFYPVYILLEDQVRFEALEADFRQKRTPIAERATQTIRALRQKAKTTQANLLQKLSISPLVKKETIRPFWVANAIFVHAQKELIATLSHDPQVAWIGYDGPLHLTETIDESPSAARAEPDGSELGLYAVNAPALWEMGYTGYGRTVFINDTGVFPHHPAINTNFSGHYPDAATDFFDAENTTTPYDCGDHGTHVCGTALGLDRLTRDTIGVAYNAQWIGAAILCGIGTADNIAAFEWALDRDGNPATTDDLPDVINNSWYDNEMTDSDCTSIYVPVLEALHTAGVAVVFSAGNEGADPMTITPPHNINVDTVNTFTVAATQIFAPYTVAGFSSRGPSLCGGEGTILIKPEVAAPGVNVRSCVPGGYGEKSGTSMASPHTSGVLLLLKEAFPYLTGRDLLMALYHTCTDLGDEGEDNDYGQGMINALAAYEYLVAQGHEPVPPVRNNDLVLVAAYQNEIACGNSIDPLVVVENDGLDTIYSFEVAYRTDSGASTVYTWEGTLIPHQQLSLPLPSLIAFNGQQDLILTLQNPNGTPDLRPLNNQMVLPVLVSNRTPNTAFALTESPTCVGSNALLWSSHTENNEVAWYAEETGGNPIALGNPLEIVEVDTNTVYYADVRNSKKTGLPDKETGENTLATITENGLVFDAISSFTLKSVKVYFETSGGREVALFDNSNHKINSKILFIIGAGEKEVVLNFDIPAGENYTLKLVDGSPFYYNDTGMDFPYEIPDVLRIKSGIQDDTPNNTYYNFYDWLVEYDDLCGRIPIEVRTTPTDSLPVAAFELEKDTLDVFGNDILTVIENSTNTVSWFWDFGDGTTSTAQAPTHTYADLGTYTVSLTVENEAGCTDAIVREVEVIDSTISTTALADDTAISIFPNPTSDVLVLSFSSVPTYQTVSFYSATGQRIKRLPIAGQSLLRITVADMPNGLYYAVFESKTQTTIRKVVVQR